MIVPVMAISNLVLTRQIYSEQTNGAHAHYREPVPLIIPLFTLASIYSTNASGAEQISETNKLNETERG